mmetsp:Transcript_20543/g.41976  ORF Transcript_20543/g.41976 Transcript_20543/m.41976 type:complete len:351 (+) Transcript_20543:223-1275(+)
MRSSPRTFQLSLCFLILVERLLSCSSFAVFPTIRVTRGESPQRQYLIASTTTPSTSTISVTNRFGSTPEYVRRNHRLCFSTTKLFGRNKSGISRQEQPVLPSIVLSLFGFVGSSDGESALKYLGSKNKKTNMIETGVETALVLGDKRRRKQWTQDVSKQFPWIPTEILSVCVDGLATAFATVAPKDLKKALQPGGLEKTRSKIGGDVVRNLQGQPIIQQLPLPKEDKRKLLAHLVDLSLDFFLKDVESAMAAPSVKLHALDRERQEIRKYMSVWQRAGYRLRYKPRSTICLGVLSLWTVFATVAFCRENYSTAIIALARQSKSFFLSIGGGMECWFRAFRVRVLNAGSFF